MWTVTSVDQPFPPSTELMSCQAAELTHLTGDSSVNNTDEILCVLGTSNFRCLQEAAFGINLLFMPGFWLAPELLWKDILFSFVHGIAIFSWKDNKKNVWRAAEQEEKEWQLFNTGEWECGRSLVSLRFVSTLILIFLWVFSWIQRQQSSSLTLIALPWY